MPEIFTIGFPEDAFCLRAGELATPGITPPAATSRLSVGSLLEGLTRTMGLGSSRIPPPAEALGWRGTKGWKI